MSDIIEHPNYSQMYTADIRKCYDAVPGHIRQAIWDRAKTACPACGTSGVPVSWALVVYDEMSAEIGTLRAKNNRLRAQVAKAWLSAGRLVEELTDE